MKEACASAADYCPFDPAAPAPLAVLEGSVKVTSCGVSGVSCAPIGPELFECQCGTQWFEVAHETGWDACSEVLPLCNPAMPPQFDGERVCQARAGQDGPVECARTEECERRTALSATIQALDGETRTAYCSHAAEASVWDCSCSSSKRSVRHFTMDEAEVGNLSCYQALAVCTSDVFDVEPASCTPSANTGADACTAITTCGLPTSTSIGKIRVAVTFGVRCSQTGGAWSCVCDTTGQHLDVRPEDQTAPCASGAEACSSLLELAAAEPGRSYDGGHP